MEIDPAKNGEGKVQTTNPDLKSGATKVVVGKKILSSAMEVWVQLPSRVQKKS